MPEPAAGFIQPAPPEVDVDRAAAIAAEGWSVRGVARSLGSHQDRNFLLDVDDGSRMLLKLANPSVTAAELGAQSAAAERIADAGMRVPRALPRADGTVFTVEIDGTTAHTRLLEFLEGETLSGGGYLSPKAIRAIGELAARVDVALAGFAAEAAERDYQWDLRHAMPVIAALLPYVPDGALRADLERTAAHAWALVEPLAGELPRQFIHGDLTDDNVVSVAGTRHPDGVIDLGDLNLTWTVGELAITVSSLLHHDGIGPVEAMPAVAAYTAVRPLSEAEADALWPLVVLRGVTLVASAHHVLATDPGNLYSAENLDHERAILAGAASIPLTVGTALVRRAAGIPTDELGLPPGAGRLCGTAPNVVDLSPTSTALDNGRWTDDGVTDAVLSAALASNALVATRFGEPRLAGTAPGPDEPRTIPLGVELRAAAPLPLSAPWAGDVLRNPDGDLILRADGLDLRLDGALTDAAAPAPIDRGAPLATATGPVHVAVFRTGENPPRLTTPSLADAWRTVVADPAPLLTGRRPEPERMDAASLLRRRDDVFAEVQEHYFDEPPVMVRGWREHLIDADGRVYLDALNNVTSIGHGHPRLVDAVARQWSLLNTNSRFHHPAVVEFSERLAALLPDPLDTVFLVNSGSEALDLALRLARAYTGRPDIVAMREAYHGWTFLSDAVSTSTADNPDALETRPDWVHTVAAPNTFRGQYGPAEAHRYADDAVAAIDALAGAGTPAGAFLSETFYGNAGGMVLPDGYLSAVYTAVRAHGGVAVADEVQVGYGRLGDWFWGFEQQGVVPDVVAVAKAMGNGHPLGAVITRRDIADAYRRGGYFFSSTGGSPVSSVVGLTVLDVLRDEGLQQNAREVGGYLKARLEALGQRYPLLGTVHGSGLYLGPEFVRDRTTWEPATEETAAICDRLRTLGVIAQPTGDHQNILKIKPPLCFTRESADQLVEALDRVLSTGW